MKVFRYIFLVAIAVFLLYGWALPLASGFYWGFVTAFVVIVGYLSTYISPSKFKKGK